MDSVRLAFPQIVARLAKFRRANHAVHTNLTGDWWAKADRSHFVDESEDFVGDVRALEVSASSAAFSGDTLGG